MRPRVLPGASIDDVVRLLDALAQNIHSQAAPMATSHPVDRRDAYVRWAVECERQLLGVLARDDVFRLFENPRHRDICLATPGDQLHFMITAEIDAKAAELRQIAQDFKDARSALTRTPGQRAVVDTNILLECQRPDYINWPEVVGGREVRLMLPLRVIEELDAKKFDVKDRRRDVAREVLPWLDGLFRGSRNGPVPVGQRTDTTIEVLSVDRPRYRPTDGDEEVLDVCHEVRLLAGDVRLVTMDGPLRMRASAEGLDVVVIDAHKYGRGI